MSMSKFVNDHHEKPFHTSSYAEAANKGNLGVTSSQSFEQRTQIERNRKAIRQYRDSLVARGHRHPMRQASTDVAPTGRETLKVDRRQAANAGPQNITPE